MHRQEGTLSAAGLQIGDTRETAEQGHTDTTCMANPKSLETQIHT